MSKDETIKQPYPDKALENADITFGRINFNNPLKNVNNFQPGARYFFTLDGGTQASPGGAAGECGPPHMDTHGIDANLWLHIPNGPSTHQILSLSNGSEIGSQLI